MVLVKFGFRMFQLDEHVISKVYTCRSIPAKQHCNTVNLQYNFPYDLPLSTVYGLGYTKVLSTLT